jgi:ferredoxin
VELEPGFTYNKFEFHHFRGLDDEQKSVAGESDGVDEETLRVAAGSCPHFAIKLARA